MRIGFRRPVRPSGPASSAVASAEARILETELRRRLGSSVLLDLRVDGTTLGPWQPTAHAAWPGAVDHVVASDEFWDGSLPPLTTLFARTVESDAADVRRRMLHHLELLPLERLDAGALTAWNGAPLRATDLWLIVTEAGAVDVDDRDIDGFAAPPGGADATRLDAAFDRLTAHLQTTVGIATLDQRLLDAEAAAAAGRIRIDELSDQLRRVEREAVERIDELSARLAVLDERAERSEIELVLDRELDGA